MTASSDRTAREPRRVSNEQVERDAHHARSCRMTVEDTFLMPAGYPGDLRDARTRIAELEAENARLAGERDEAWAARDEYMDSMTVFGNEARKYRRERDAALVRATAAEAKLRAAWEACQKQAAIEVAKHRAGQSLLDAIRRLQPPAEHAGEVVR